jgi:threonine/homoserine/homoserine lactone efflux protein
MNAAAGLLFATALAAAVATPGPSTAAVVARVLARGPRGATLLCAGLLAGDVFWLLAAVSGAAVLATRFDEAFAVIRYAGAAYLFYCAVKLWLATPAAATRNPRDESGLLLSGLAIALGNPKTVLFYLALLPGIVRVDALSLRDVCLLVALTTAIVAGVLSGYALLAARLRHHLHSPAALQRINRISAVLMAAAATAIVLR